MLGAKEFREKFESDAAFRSKFEKISDKRHFFSAARAEGYDIEIIDDEVLENVVGGIATMYVFPYVKNADGSVTYDDAPLAVPASTNLTSFMMENIPLFTSKPGLISGSNSSFRNFVQDFADDNASRWNRPWNWGNVVFTYCINTMKGERFEA